ncbi:MurR/RpiR family transcriptional regulator [Novosphingobium mathurense]|uniref:Transcriptional regulator, RpiR family n=1 Tax=Novosphingobium mathurense TaxID=428990 RepID=A0A1U6H691_9SPHN|nr:MurR/RpiR family transcriptional regulator [Novosphingobium mathurense]SLJ91301.1 transcriptional regulator, RpiR family [Novosphingobium mathurense]
MTQNAASQTHLPPVGVLSRMRTAKPGMGEKGAGVIDFILARPEDFMGMSVTDLAEATGVSESYVIKICRQLGLNGLQQLKVAVGQDLVAPTQFIHEDLETGDDIATTNRKIFHANIAALQDTLNVLSAGDMKKAVELILEADRIELYGIGSAAPVAADAHYRMMRIGLLTRMADDSHLQAVSASLANERVTVITISHSGSTQETIAATRLAKEAGARTILITGFRKSPIQRYCDVVLHTMARETKFRTEAMTSRIAQLSIVDALIANLALARHDRSVEALQHTFDVLGQKRF